MLGPNLLSYLPDSKYPPPVLRYYLPPFLVGPNSVPLPYLSCTGMISILSHPDPALTENPSFIPWSQPTPSCPWSWLLPLFPFSSWPILNSKPRLYPLVSTYPTRPSVSTFTTLALDLDIDLDHPNLYLHPARLVPSPRQHFLDFPAFEIKADMEYRGDGRTYQLVLFAFIWFMKIRLGSWEV